MGTGSSGALRRTVARLTRRPTDWVVGQLEAPHGPAAPLIGRVLDRASRRLIAAAVDALDPARGAQVADVGFGAGAGLAALIARVGITGTVIGIDPSPEVVARASRRFADAVRIGHLDLREGGVDALPVGDAELDGAISVNGVHFWPDLRRGLAELRRALRPGAPLVLGVGNLVEQERLFGSTGHRVVGGRELGDELRATGFTRIAVAAPRGADGPSLVRAQAP